MFVCPYCGMHFFEKPKGKYHMNKGDLPGMRIGWKLFK
jgi:hypothetical protein